jgi:hypothetical protein
VCSIKQYSLVGIGQKNPSIFLFFVLLDFVAVKLFFNWLEQSMARGIYIIIHSAANFIVNEHLIIYRILIMDSLNLST